MAITYEPIATATADGSSGTITFSSIPATFTDIVLVVSGTISAGSNVDCLVRLNTDSGNNYSRTFMFGNGTSAISDRNSNLNGIYVIALNSSQICNSTLHFMNYANTTTYKTVLGRNNAGNTAAYACIWRSTSAINRFDCITTSGNWASGTVLTLYGIKAA